MAIVSGFVVLALAYGLWIWRKDGRSFQPFRDRIRYRIRSALGVVSRDEIQVMQERVQHKEQQLENRLTRVEGATKFSNQLQNFSKEIDRRLIQLERPENLMESLASPLIHHPRSIVRLGLRLTLSDMDNGFGEKMEDRFSLSVIGFATVFDQLWESSVETKYK